jgi:ankyrin repeat protein
MGHYSNLVNSEYYNKFYNAVINDIVSDVSMILDMGYKPYNFIHKAVSYKSHNVLSLLLKSKMYKSKGRFKDDFWIALEIAVNNDDLRSLQIVMEHLDLSANEVIMHSIGRTLLWLAAQAGAGEICKHLVKLKADPFIKVNGVTSREQAERKGHKDIAELLREREHSIRFKNIIIPNIGVMFEAERISRVTSIREGEGDTGIAKARSHHMQTYHPLILDMSAIKKKSQENNIALNVKSKDYNQLDDLQYAIVTNDIERVKKLLDLQDSGPDLNCMWNGETALFTSILAENLEIVKLLIEHGANLHFTNDSNHNAYTFALSLYDFAHGRNPENTPSFNRNGMAIIGLLRKYGAHKLQKDPDTDEISQQPEFYDNVLKDTEEVTKFVSCYHFRWGSFHYLCKLDRELTPIEETQLKYLLYYLPHVDKQYNPKSFAELDRIKNYFDSSIINLAANMYDGEGNTMLYLAAKECRSVDDIDVLLKFGADVNASNIDKNYLHGNSWHPIAGFIDNENLNDEQKRIALQRLIDAGARLNERCGFGTPLEYATFRAKFTNETSSVDVINQNMNQERGGTSVQSLPDKPMEFYLDRNRFSDEELASKRVVVKAGGFLFFFENDGPSVGISLRIVPVNSTLEAADNFKQYFQACPDVISSVTYFRQHYFVVDGKDIRCVIDILYQSSIFTPELRSKLENLIVLAEQYHESATRHQADLILKSNSQPEQYICEDNVKQVSIGKFSPRLFQNSQSRNNSVVPSSLRHIELFHKILASAKSKDHFRLFTSSIVLDCLGKTIAMDKIHSGNNKSLE